MTQSKFDSVDTYDFLGRYKKARVDPVTGIIDPIEAARRERSLLNFSNRNIIELAELQLSMMNGEYALD